MSYLDVTSKNFVLFGFANKKSIACHVGRRLIDEGANIALVVHTEANREAALKCFPGTYVFVCDVGDLNQIQAVSQSVAKVFPEVHGLLHSIAFANYSQGWKPFHETVKEDFLEAAGISCFSLIHIAKAFKPLLHADASVVAMSISTTRQASENYGYMAPIKAALDSAVCFLAKSFSAFSRVRFNTVNAGLLKTRSSAGIPNYVTSYLYAEKMILRKQALGTEEVANTAVFLLSPASSGINATGIRVDAGMAVNAFDSELIERVMRVDQG